MDQTDTTILNILQEEGNITNVELAKRVGLAPATTLDRVRKLERRGIIRGYVALVDSNKVNRGTTAFVSISLSSHDQQAVKRFRERIGSLPEVLECYYISGANDYLLKVVVADLQDYEAFLLEKLTAVPGVGRIHTSFVLSELKHRTGIPLDEG